MLWLPLVVFEPDQPPEAVQLLALFDDQLSVAALPLATEAGAAVSETVGAGGGGIGGGGRVPGELAAVVVVTPPSQPVEGETHAGEQRGQGDRSSKGQNSLQHVQLHHDVWHFAPNAP